MTCVHYALRDSFGPCLRTLELLLSACFAEHPNACRMPTCLTEQRTQAMPSNSLVRLLYGYVLDHEEKELRREHQKRCTVLLDEMLNRPDSTGATLMHYCALQGNYRAVHLLAKYGADFSTVQIDGKTASDLARDCVTRKALAMYPRSQTVSTTTDATCIHKVISANCEYVNSEYGLAHRTPLHMALLASSDGFDIGTLLKEFPEADPLVPDASGWSCIHYACALGFDAALLNLLVRAKDIHGATKRRASVPLSDANVRHRTSGVGGGRDGSTRSSGGKEALMGRTPTHLAAQGDHIPCLEVLCKQGWFDLESKDDSGRTPLLSAAASGCARSVRWLLDANCQLTAQDHLKRNCLHLAVQQNHRTTIHLLMRWDADFGQLKRMHDCKGRVPKAMVGTGWSKDTRARPEDLATIWEGAMHGDLDEVLCALACGRYHIDEVSPGGWTSVMYAAKNGHSAVMKYLIEKGATVDLIPTSCKRAGPVPTKLLSALHWACKKGHMECAELLLQHQADVNQHDTGMTPLMAAAYAAQPDCCTTLLRWKSDVSLKDKEGRSVLIYLIRGAVKVQPNDHAYANILQSLNDELGEGHALWSDTYIKDGISVDPAEEIRSLNYERQLAGLPCKGKTSRFIQSMKKGK